MTRPSARDCGFQASWRLGSRGVASRARGLTAFLATVLTTASPAFGEEPSRWARVLFLQDYNTRIVLLGSTVLGASLGAVGVFMLLRRRSLMGDVVSHAALPGIAAAFLIAEAWSPGSGKSLPNLLAGATLFGGLGVLVVLGLRHFTRIKEDAALAIVLSVFFGAGVVLLSVVQAMPFGNASGLQQFIYGQAASMVANDARLIVISSTVALLLIGLLFKEFRLLCFDEKYGRSMGWPVVGLDLLIMALVVAMSVIGIQSVGLLLVVAMLIIPAAAARFWSDRLPSMTLAAAFLGGASAYVGVAISAMAPRLAAGAVIVLTGAAFFTVSMLLGSRRGLVPRYWTMRSLRIHVENQHLLRAVFEHLETSCSEVEFDLSAPFLVSDLPSYRDWSEPRAQRILSRCASHGWAEPAGDAWRLTSAGEKESRRLVRNHRLWELYLIEYADVAPSHVDRDADDIEHVLGEEIVSDLERLMEPRLESRFPSSPHELNP